MNLKNKDITEGMRVSNGKYELRVVSWDKSYTDCLLNYLDSKGNRYVVAQNYELSGTEKDPQISWMNGRYFTANSDDEALEEYLDYLGEVNGYDISESLKESKEFFVGDKTSQGFEVCMIEDGKKYYLSKLAKNVVDSDWSSDHTYAKHWKDESKAEEIVDMLNSELKENKKVMNEKVDSRYKYVFNHTKDEYEVIQFDDYNFEILAIPNGKSVFSDDLPKFKIEKTYIYDTCVNNKDITLFVGIVEELGWCFIAFDKLANNNNIFAYYISGKTKEGAYHSFHEYKSEYNLRCEESKKSSRKSLKESAKPINEKNVAKFVDELNKWCDDNVHYKDVDSAKFTKQYGKLYDFGYNWDYSYGDKGDLLVFDKEETLDWYDDEVVVPFIKQLAKKYGWYCEPAHSYADFMFAEL